MVRVPASGSKVSMAHSSVSSATRASWQMVLSRSSRSMVEVMARLALSRAPSRRVCSASRPSMRAVCTATAAGTARSSSRLQVVGGEPPRGALLDQRQRPDHLVLEEQRHAEDAALAPPLHGGALPVGDGRVVRLELPHGPLVEHAPVARPLGHGVHRAEPRLVVLGQLARPERRGDEGVGLGTVLVDVALPHVQRLRDAPRDHGEHGVEVGGGGDRLADSRRQREDVRMGRARAGPAARRHGIRVSRHGRPPCRARDACPRRAPRPRRR